MSNIPTKSEQAEVKHHLVDVIDIRESYSSGDFKDAAKNAAREIYSRGHLPILVGGSGLYVELVVNDFSLPEISSSEEIRAELRREAILNARAKANEIATAIDQSIGSCIYVLDYNSGGDINFSPRNYANRAKGYSSADFAAESEVFVPEFTKERVEYSLQAKFELHPQKVR